MAEVRAKKERNPYVWPELPFKELMCMIVVMIVLIVWSLWLNAPLNEIATPTRTENPAKAPWYFIGLQELLVYFDPWFAGVVLPGIIIFGLMAIPYLDKNPKGQGAYDFAVRRFAMFNFLFGYLLWMGAIVVGQFMRGPSWFFYWPWETWDVHAKHTMVALKNIAPRTGLIAIGVYFLLWYLVPLVIGRRFFRQLGLSRYVILTTLMALMYAVPMKIILRQVFHIKYVLVTPWFNI